MSQDELKKAVAKAAMKLIQPYLDGRSIIGIGTGSTVDYLIDLLAEQRDDLAGAVASSERSAKRLIAGGITVVDLNGVQDLPVYIDGADEVTESLSMLKGGGGALTREKIVAAVASKFIGVVDASKRVPYLGQFPLPVEVIPIARSYVARQLMKLSSEHPFVEVNLRQGEAGKPFITDNGNVILDVRGLKVMDPVSLEARLNEITGVVDNGLFARRRADVCLLASEQGIETIQSKRSY